MDIDIDLPPSVDISELFGTAIPGSKLEDGVLKKHNVGYYFQGMPVDAITGYAAIPYTESEDFGYLKIDLLGLHLLKYFDSKQEMRDLAKEEPDWSLLRDEDVVKQLFHIGNHYRTTSKIGPSSIIELADLLAIIRPNKKGLIYKYIQNPKKIRPELYTKRSPSDMRKSHAVAYAILIGLQLHLIKQGRYEIDKKNSK